jgi:hypothetical protein
MPGDPNGKEDVVQDPVPTASPAVAPALAAIPGLPSGPAKAAEKELFFASVEPGLDTPLPENCSNFARAVLEYEEKTGLPAFVLVQNDALFGKMDTITLELGSAICGADLPSDKRISLILHTFGGDPQASYRIATCLQKKTQGFEVVVPKMAKSGGTLVCLGALKIIMAPMAELGPLDMQVKDEETDLWDSALNETKALQTLSKEALILYAEKMELLSKLYRSKAFETKNRIATEFVNEMIRPLVEKINAVHYTKMARIMEIMKKYGRELMVRAGYSSVRATKAVDALGDGFPDHSYIIDSREAREVGLRTENAKPDVVAIIDKMTSDCGLATIVGRISSSMKP